MIPCKTICKPSTTTKIKDVHDVFQFQRISELWFKQFSFPYELQSSMTSISKAQTISYRIKSFEV